MENDRVAQRIRAFRKLKGYTQLELADKMNLSVSILGSVERGTRIPDAKLLNQIAYVLEIDVEELTK